MKVIYRSGVKSLYKVKNIYKVRKKVKKKKEYKESGQVVLLKS